MLNKRASEVMVRPVISARKNASARDVALQMMNGLYSGMPVTDDNGKVIGMITEMDILNSIMKGKQLETTLVGDIMTSKVEEVNLDTAVCEIIKIMNEKKIIRVPVVDKEGQLRGIISRCDILRARIEPEFVSYM
jgi:predicted transcriptional regulator